MAGAVDVARNAAERHSWREAYDAYTGSDDSGLTPDDQEQFADAAWWTGKIDEAIGLRERSYAGFSAAGDRLGAARLALTVRERGAPSGRPAGSAGARVSGPLPRNHHPVRGGQHRRRPPGARAGP